MVIPGKSHLGCVQSLSVTLQIQQLLDHDCWRILLQISLIVLFRRRKSVTRVEVQVRKSRVLLFRDIGDLNQ